MDKSNEVMVVRGYLDRAGRFTLRRSRSTTFVRQWPVVEKSDVAIELLDADGNVLHRELAEVKRDTTCDPGAARRFRVLAHIGLREAADAVRLMRDGELEVWRAAIPPAPSLRIALTAKRAGADRKVQLRLRYSAETKEAHLTLVYQWGDRRFRPLYVGPPAESLVLDLRDMPGGEACRVVASYSNGLRSAQDATATFRVPRLGPEVMIASPDRGFVHVAGTPLTLEASLRDDERAGGPEYEALLWTIDGVEVGRGLVASVDGLCAGRHKVELTYRAEPGASASMTITSRAAKVTPAEGWEAWDPMR
ncbi:hypothetical protein BH20VER1_BH20VER1_14700 [soil metagenome]